MNFLHFRIGLCSFGAFFFFFNLAHAQIVTKRYELYRHSRPGSVCARRSMYALIALALTLILTFSLFFSSPLPSLYLSLSLSSPEADCFLLSADEKPTTTMTVTSVR